MLNIKTYKNWYVLDTKPNKTLGTHINDLPDECLLRILQYINPISERCRLSEICVRWYYLVLRSLARERHLRILSSGLRIEPSFKIILAMQKVTRVTITYKRPNATQYPADPKISMYFGMFSVVWRNVVKFSFRECTVTNQHLLAINQCCPRLNSITLYNCRLHLLDLTSATVCEILAQKVKSITTFDYSVLLGLGSSKPFPALVSLTISSKRSPQRWCPIQWVANSCLMQPSILHLTLVTNVTQADMTMELLQIHSNVPWLASLSMNMACPSQASPYIGIQIIGMFGNLRRIELIMPPDCQDFRDNCIVDMVRPLNNLRELRLMRASRTGRRKNCFTSGDVLRKLSPYVPRLHTLQLDMVQALEIEQLAFIDTWRNIKIVRFPKAKLTIYNCLEVETFSQLVLNCPNWLELQCNLYVASPEFQHLLNQKSETYEDRSMHHILRASYSYNERKKCQFRLEPTPVLSYIELNT